MNNELIELLNQISLIENKVDDLRVQYVDSKKLSAGIFNILLSKDPTPQKKYFPWILKTFINAPAGIDKYNVVKDFEELINKNLIQNKDIYSYPSVEAVYDEVKKHEGTKTQGEQEREIQRDQTEVVFENDQCLIVRPKTKESSCKYGSGTKWCTAASKSNNYFNDYYYNRKVNLYYVIKKNPTEGDRYSKFAIVSPRSGEQEFFDARDNSMNAGKVNELLKDLGVPGLVGGKKKVKEDYEPQPQKAPETPTRKPTTIEPPTKPETKPVRPATPLKPTPGISPRPKAMLNRDEELFVKARQ